MKSLPEKTGDERLIAISAEDEIGTLAVAFNEMTATLDRKRAALQAAVTRAENERARTEAIIAAIGEGISIQDREFKVLYQNRIHKERIGSHEGKFCYEAYSHRDAVCPECAVALAFSDGRVHTIEKTNLIGGKPMYLEITASPLRDASGEIVAGIELVRDVTEHKENEGEIYRLNAALQRRAAELTAMNRELEAFSYSLSHDLKTPLTSIYAAAQTLADDCADGLDETGRFMVTTICKSIERMEELLNAMLLLSRVSRAELRREKIDLTSLAHEVLLWLSVKHPERKVEWVIESDISAEGDPGLLTSVLENLLGNAWKYTRNQAAARIEFGTAAHNGARAFFVRDNGAGFDGDRATELFRPFRRLHSPEEFEGMGIGLATVQRIIVRHGGRVWAEGEAGNGATFYFTLPIALHHDAAPIE
ncbi:MAG TPA: ATP-binding protein [Geobacteraceae bacterium]